MKPLELFSETDYSGESFYISWKTIVSLSRWVAVTAYLFLIVRLIMLTEGKLYHLIIKQIWMLLTLILVVIGSFLIFLLGLDMGVKGWISDVYSYALPIFIIADVIGIGVVWKKMLIGDNNTTI